MIKEGNDRVRCLQGGILDVVPEKFLPFDVVFACYFPGMGVGVEELVGAAARWCSPGGRLVISFDQGRQTIEREHRKLHPDIAASDLPDKITLEKAAANHSFQVTEFVDEPSLYLAVLNLTA
ncbi:uncharacterized protein A4U43_C07F36210 [Asparagus officinalis]|uniref:Methyltransferase type 11 domain-containing protein n=2 Tax=Asparagus officinalis TaxID=4686 RepID=A0A5P1EMT3_ASPOF|nr:uncharacterized protein A4U43_C07F36210 [Asparagus officinalis]